MTTEHVSVPREELEELVSHFRKRAKQWADFGKYTGEAEATQCADDLQAILSLATPDGRDIHADAVQDRAYQLNTPSAASFASDLVNEGLAYFYKAGDNGDKEYIRAIRAHIAALESLAASLPAARVPDGLVLVPVEPTDDMYMAGQSAHYQAEEECRIELANADETSFFNEKPGTMRRRKNRAAHVYKAMLAAAPQAGERG